MAEALGGWRRTGREVLHSGPFVRLVADTVQGPYAPPFRYEHVEVADAVRTVALDDEQRLLLVEDDFYLTGRRMPHLPGGGMEAGEVPEAAARRELEEETGLRAARWRPLGAIHPLPSSTSAVTHLFLATGLSAGTMARDETEAAMTVRRCTVEEALALVTSGEITEAGSVAAVLLAARLSAAGG
ncbi:NUDIX domain-containing protein [Kitasatospora sp. DSM 101779]|uniref:NUDIX domain-containing protein n=1 Tax=Kitasatospora sp. DSM 101779 TaxID=2853165 RepID=UPI0021DB157B|nr:NUDIX hydrolase [Kitasatospora sp. DSM 101779]MCU7826640.1 NUDIX hydrolase [Kitasatospora sp. DSM 101779]